MQTFDLRICRNETYEAGAAVVAWLAFPQDPAEQRRIDLHAALCNVALRELYLGSDQEHVPQCMKPVYVFQGVRCCDAADGPAEAGIALALGGRTHGHPFAQEVQLGHPPSLPPHIERLNVSRMAAEVMEMALHSDMQNVYNRVWRASKPVLPLCVALRVVSVDFYKLYGRGLSCVDLMLDAGLLRHFIGFAEEMAEVLPRNPRLGLDPERLIRVRLRDSQVILPLRV